MIKFKNIVGSFLLVLVVNLVTAQPVDMKEQAKDDAMQLSEKDYPQIDNFHKALRLQFAGNIKEAKALFLQCIEENPKNDAAYFALGNIAMKEEFPTRAKGYYKKAYELDNLNFYYLQSLALINLEFANIEEALPQFEKLVKHEPRNPDFRYYLAQCYIYNVQYNKAIKELNAVENYVGVLPQISYIKVDLYKELNQKAELKEELKKLRLADPYNPKTESIVLNYYRSIDSLDHFYQTLEKDLSLEDPNPSSLIYLLNKKDLATATKNKVLQKGIGQKTLPSVYIAQNLEYMAKEKVIPKKEVDSIANLFMEDFADNKTIRDEVVKYLEFNGSSENILVLAKKSLESKPNDFKAWYKILELQSALGMYNELLETSNNAIDNFPLLPQFHLFRAQAKAFISDLDGAQEDIDMAQAYNYVKNDTTSFLMHLCKAQMSAVNGATAAYEKEIRNARDLDVLNDYFSILSTTFNLYYKKSTSEITYTGELAKEQIYYLEAKRNFYLGDYKTSAELVTKYLDIYNSQPEALDLLGDIFSKLQDVNEANTYWKLALENHSINLNINKKLETNSFYESKYF